MPKVKSITRSLDQPTRFVETLMPSVEDLLRYAAAESMLRETLEYLKRLPTHPKTHEFIKKLSAHLDDPSLLLTRERAKLAKEIDERDRYSQHGHFGFLRSGAPALSALLVGRSLTLKSEGLASETEDPEYIRRAQGRLLQRLVGSGVQIELSPCLGMVGQGPASSEGTVATMCLPMVETSDRAVVDAVEVQPRPKLRTHQGAKVLAKKPKAVSSVSVQPVAAPPIKKGNDQRVLTYLQSRLNRKSFVRLPGREIAAGAALPLGSVAASMRALIKAGLVINQERGYYKLA